MAYHVVLTAAVLAAHRQANRRFEVAYQAFLDALPDDEIRSHGHVAGTPRRGRARRG